MDSELKLLFDLLGSVISLYLYDNLLNWFSFSLDVYILFVFFTDGRVLCVHGGLSPRIVTIDQIRLLERNQEIPHEGPFCDLMWSDPEDIDDWAVSQRGAGWLFGSKVTAEFNHRNGLELICRAHQLVQEGYKYMFPEKNLITVWSAPNCKFKNLYNNSELHHTQIC
jgi:diadenosine tetraphosphatase ApaH/serine/threonine PP2A family protein phosphatase